MRGLRLLIIFNLFLASAVSFQDTASYEKNKLQQRGSGTLINKPNILTHGSKGKIDDKGNDSEASTEKFKRETLPASENVDGVPHESGWNYKPGGEHKLQRRVGETTPGHENYNWRQDPQHIDNGGEKTQWQLIDEHKDRQTLKSQRPSIPSVHVPQKPEIREGRVYGSGYMEDPQGRDTMYTSAAQFPDDIPPHTSRDPERDYLRSEIQTIYQDQLRSRRARTWQDDITDDNSQRDDMKPPLRAETFPRGPSLRRDPRIYIPLGEPLYRTTVSRRSHDRSGFDAEERGNLRRASEFRRVTSDMESLGLKKRPNAYYESSYNGRSTEDRAERAKQPVEAPIPLTRMILSKHGDYEEGWSLKLQKYIPIPRRPDGDGIVWEPKHENWAGFSVRENGYVLLGKQPDGTKWDQEKGGWVPTRPPKAAEPEPAPKPPQKVAPDGTSWVRIGKEMKLLGWSEEKKKYIIDVGSEPEGAQGWNPKTQRWIVTNNRIDESADEDSEPEAVPGTRWVTTDSGTRELQGYYKKSDRAKGRWILAEKPYYGAVWSTSRGRFVYPTRGHHKRNVITDVNKQMQGAGQPSSTGDTAALIQQYINATYELEAVASQRLWPVLERMVNGSTSPVLYEAAWSIQAQMLGTTDSVIGPFWNGYSTISDWEDQWLLSRGFWLDANGTIFMPPGNNHTITNETLRETRDMLAFNQAVSDSYYTAWAEGLKAVNGSDNTLGDLIFFKSALLGLNETLLPESETQVPTGPSPDAAWFEQGRDNNSNKTTSVNRRLV